MKNRNKGSFLPLAVLPAGAAAMLLRRQLYMTAVDVKGLLVRGTLPGILLTALSAAVFCLVFLAVKKDKGSSLYEDNYSADIPAGLGHVAAAAGIFLLTRGSGISGYLGQLWRVLGLAAPVCLVLAGIFRILGKKPFFLLHVIPCVFLMIQLVGSYRQWSSNPQMQDYLFALLASLALMLFAHYTAAFEAGLGNRKMVLGSGLLAVYLCLAELGCTEHPAMYFGGAFWALTGMCAVTLPPEGEADGGI